jgi:CRP-like cAMP-binding protein
VTVRSVLRYLTADDEEVLLAAATRLAYSPGDVIVRGGKSVPAMFVLRSGRAHVALEGPHDGGPLVRLAPGDVFGESLLLPDEGSCLAVFADDEVSADLIEGRAIEMLVASRPGFGLRFFRSLAGLLLRRVQQLAGVASARCSTH